METNKYRLLIKIADFQNITTAAKAMNYTQSAASHAITSLENELGLKLLQRTRTGTQLTPEGEMLLPTIREIVKNENHLNALVNSILSMQTGTLKIGSFTSAAMVFLPHVVSKFHAQYPNITVEVYSGNGSYYDLEHALTIGLIDCSFLCSPVPGQSELYPPV